MSYGTIIYLVAMLALFVGERLLVDNPLQGWVEGAAVVGLLAAIAMRVRALPKANGDGLRKGHRLALILLLVGCASVVLYLGTTDSFVRSMKFDEQAEERWLGSMKSLWPLVWLLGTVPLLVVDHALNASPVVMPVGRIRDSLTHGLVAAMGIAIVFPLNYIAKEKNERWDLAYFKTPSPGTATEKLVEALAEPVTVRIFMPPSSEVAQELRAYFAPIEGPKLSVEIIDQAANPRLAKALAVRDNGTIALTTGDISALMEDPKPPAEDGAEPEPEPTEETPKPVTKRVRVSPELEKAKRTLTKIDREVQKALIELGQGERIAYLTSGHGELDWSGEDNPAMSIRGFRTALVDMGFRVKTLGAQQGLGEKVPDDASVVMVLGPVRQFHEAEVNALQAYLDAGGSVLIALPPKLELDGRPPVDDPIDRLLEELGVRRGNGILASERNILARTNNKEDRFNTVTNSFTSHPSSRELADMGRNGGMFTPGAGFLEEVEGRETDITFTVRSLATTWADTDLDAEMSADKGESQEVRNLVAAITGGGEGPNFRALVMAAPTVFVDGAVLRFVGNQQFAVDGVNWLIGAEDLTGTTETEEDVKIEHTKEGQATWFYGTVLGVPLLVIGLGAARVRLRRKPTVVPGGAAQGAGEARRVTKAKAEPEPEPEDEADDEADDEDKEDDR